MSGPGRTPSRAWASWSRPRYRGAGPELRADERRAAPRAWAHRRRVRADRAAHGPRAERRGAGDVLAAVVRALRLQALAKAPGCAADRGRARGHGAGGERRGRESAGWLGARL